ncbi:MAG: DUF3105 domain-containing protein [Acidimicrobiales bacterium]|nr:DUF3105 domain-containing protein [Acidimicrobiales bacterium]
MRLLAIRNQVLAVLCVTVATVSACGGGGADVCTGVVTEALDPASGQHVTAGTEVVYLTDPPTSGPHAAVPIPAGIRSDSLHPTLQVGVLETGRVLVQFRDLTDDEIAELEDLVASDVVIAPNDTLPATIVATAWQHRLDCTAVDVDALQRFATEFNGANVNH